MCWSLTIKSASFASHVFFPRELELLFIHSGIADGEPAPPPPARLVRRQGLIVTAYAAPTIDFARVTSEAICAASAAPDSNFFSGRIRSINSSLTS